MKCCFFLAVYHDKSLDKLTKDFYWRCFQQTPMQCIDRLLRGKANKKMPGNAAFITYEVLLLFVFSLMQAEVPSSVPITDQESEFEKVTGLA